MSSSNREQTAPKNAKLDSSTKLRLWLLNNYEYCEGSEAHLKSVLAHAQVSSKLLTSTINQVWKGKIKVSRKRSSDNHERYQFYKNLKQRIATEKIKNEISELQSLDKLCLPSRWILVRESPKHSSLVYISRFILDNQRIVHEISFIAVEQDIIITINYGSFKVTVDEDFSLGGTLTEKAQLLMQLIESFKFCIGIPVELTENYKITENCYINIGFLKELIENPSVNEVRAFSKSCKVLSDTPTCKFCTTLRGKEQRKQKRKMTRDSLNCSARGHNHRYMSKDEIISLFREEKRKRLIAEAHYNSLLDKSAESEDGSEAEGSESSDDENKSGEENEIEEKSEHEAFEEDETENTGLKWKIAGSNGLMKFVKL